MDRLYSFRVSADPAETTAETKGERCLHAALSGGVFTLDLFYDFAPEEPLRLSADGVCPGDSVVLRLCAYRAELFVNGALRDEEWPCGIIRIAETDRVTGNLPFSAMDPPFPARETEPPKMWIGAEGWRPGNGVYVGDCMPYVCDGRFHVLYLKDRHRHQSKWRRGAHQWEHISSPDLVRWSTHPMAVPIDDPREGSICTGSFIRNGSLCYLFYTVRTMDGSPAPIRRSLSRDGERFAKDGSFSFTLDDRYTAASARDPKVVQDDNGVFHMFVTTTVQKSGKGCLVHLTSPDLDRWTEAPAPIYVAPDGNEPECSDYFRFAGKYYLVFSHYGKAEYRYSDRPFDGWQTPQDPYIPCGAVPKAGVFQGRLLFVGFAGNEGKYAGYMTFREMAAAENGELFVKNEHPVPDFIF